MLMLAFLLILPVPAGYARRGRLRHYLEHPLRGLWLPIVAYALEFSRALEKHTALAALLVAGRRRVPEYAMLFAFVWFQP